MSISSILNNYFDKQKKSSTGYSMAEYSKYLGIHRSTLSKILSGQRGLPKSHTLNICEKLELKGKKKDDFLELSLNQSFKKIPSAVKSKKVILEDTKNLDLFNIISQWEYFAILNIIQLKATQHNAKYISKRLGISTFRTNKCIQVLLEHKFIAVKGEKFVRLKGPLFTKTNEFSRSLQLAHLQELELVKSKIEVDVKLRHFRSHFVRIAKKDISKVKVILESFYDSIDKITDTPDAEEVYLLSTQFVPLTKKI